MTRLVVLGLLVLTAFAAADAIRGGNAPRPQTERAAAAPSVELLAGTSHEFVAAGGRLDDRVLRNGREYLSAKAIRAAFPVDVPGPIAISRLAVARDGTLALGLYRFPSATPAQGAVELWRGGVSIGGFPVPPGYFGGGLAFNRDGTLVATFSYDGQLRGIFDRDGRRLSGLPKSFLVVD